MIVFNNNSWHYKLVLFVFGDSFFTEKDEINFDATVKKKKVVWITKPRVVNFCPYCRAVVMSVVFLPFAWLLKKLPKRKQKPFDIKKSRRNTKILKIIVISILGLWGIYSLIHGSYGMAIFQFGAASFQIWGQYVFKWYAKWHQRRMERKTKEENPKPTVHKNPNLVLTYLQSNHDKICPPVAFVDPNDTEVRV